MQTQPHGSSSEAHINYLYVLAAARDVQWND